MTVGDLVEKLSKYPPSMWLVVEDKTKPDAYEYETIEVFASGDDEVTLEIR